MGYITDGQPEEAPLAAAIPGYEATPPTFGAGFLAEAKATSPTRFIADWLQRGVAGQKGIGGTLARGLTVEAGQEGGMSPEQMGLTPQGEALPSPEMSADEINDKLAPIGADGQKVKLTSSPMPAAVAQVVAKQKAAEIERDGVISRFQNAHSWPVNFATGTAAFMMDPLNVAGLFVPGFGEEAVTAALGGGLLARLAGRAVVGAEVGAASQVPLTAIRYGTSDEASEYNLRDALRDMTFAAAGNAVLGAGAGAVGEFLGRGAPAAETPKIEVPEAQKADLAAVTKADAQTKYDAMKTAVSQVADGREVDVAPVLERQPLLAAAEYEMLPAGTEVHFNPENGGGLIGKIESVSQKRTLQNDLIPVYEVRTPNGELFQANASMIQEGRVAAAPTKEQIPPSQVAAKQAALYKDGFDQSLPQTEYNAANQTIYGPKEEPTVEAPKVEGGPATEADQRLAVAQHDLKAIEASGTPIHPEDKAAIDAANADLAKVDDLEGAAQEAAGCAGLVAAFGGK